MTRGSQALPFTDSFENQYFISIYFKLNVLHSSPFLKLELTMDFILDNKYEHKRFASLFEIQENVHKYLQYTF